MESDLSKFDRTYFVGQSINQSFSIPSLRFTHSGIGTGWSTKIPNYNPRDVVENVRRLIKNEPVKKMTPWYKGFEGEIVALDSGSRIVIHGEISTLSNNRVQITELPVKVWTQTFKENVLESLLHGSDKVY